MLEIIGVFAEMFSYGEIIGFIWLYIFSKNYRENFKKKWNEKNLGIEKESKASLIVGIIFSILFNALIICAVVYIVL